MRGHHAGLRPSAVGLPRWLAGAAAALLLAAAVALAVVGVPEPVSGIGDAFDNLVRNLLTALVLGALAYLWFYFWTSERATRHLRQAAQKAPEELFPIRPQIGSADLVFGRERLVEEIVTSLRAPFRARPQVVVGDTGSGKTTLLLAVAEHLARERGVLPIVLTLRDREDFDFTALALERFREQIDPYVRTESEVDKLWRWMRHRGQIAVLADDLDRSKLATEADPYKTEIRLRLDAAYRRDLPLVVASRPAGVPPDLDEPPIDLSRQPVEVGDVQEARNHVLKLAGKRAGDSEVEAVVEDNITAGTLIDNPFYLGLLAELLRADRLARPPEGGEHLVRLALLDAKRSRLRDQAAVDPGQIARREETLEDIERFAAASLGPESQRHAETEWVDIIHDGERLGLLHLDEQGRHRFTHDVLHAYFASRVLKGDRNAWSSALSEDPDAPRVQLALVLAAARPGGEDFCRDVCSQLLADEKAVPADLILTRAAAAAEVARAGNFNGLDEKIAKGCSAARFDAGPLAKRAALDQLHQLNGRAAVEALWDYGADDDYAIRWAAVQKLVARCSGRAARRGATSPDDYLTGPDAYDVLDPKLEEALRRAKPLLALPENERPDDWQPEIVPLKQMAWLLPAIRTGADDEVLRERIGGRLDALLDLERNGVTPQRGLEASVAQGFKVDAMLHRDASVDAHAADMLRERAVFWYSQLNLVHAVALRMANADDANARDLEKLLHELENRERSAHEAQPDGAAVDAGPHPLMRAAADLCVQALKAAPPKRRAEMELRIWDDEGVVVSGRPTTLAPEAAQLVGEITILLNLNETGSEGQRERFGRMRTMPHCIETSRTREEFFGGCHESCAFRLCPFQPTGGRLSAHRETSLAFCRDQRINASARIARRWGSRVRQRSLLEFWRRLESRARI